MCGLHEALARHVAARCARRQEGGLGKVPIPEQRLCMQMAWVAVGRVRDALEILAPGLPIRTVLCACARGLSRRWPPGCLHWRLTWPAGALAAHVQALAISAQQHPQRDRKVW